MSRIRHEDGHLLAVEQSMTVPTSDTIHKEHRQDKRAQVTCRSNSSPVPATSASTELRLWNTIWLQVGNLYGILALLVILIVSLISIFVVSQQRHGLGSPVSTYRYAWTYGPTASQSYTYSYA